MIDFKGLGMRAMVWLLDRYKVHSVVLYINYRDDRPAWIAQIGMLDA